MNIFQKLLIPLIFLLFSKNLPAQLTPIPQNWQQDGEKIRKELPKLHPNLFQKIKEKEWNQAFTTFYQNLPEKSDAENALRLQEIIAKVGDPNTTLDLTPILKKEKFIPFGLGYYEFEFYVSASVRKFAPIFGCKVLKINGLTTKEAIERTARFVPKDNEIGYLTNAMQMLRFPIVNRLTGVSATDTLELFCEKPTGETFNFKVFPIDPAADPQAMQPIMAQRKNPDLLFRSRSQLFVSEWLEKDSIFIFQYAICLSREMLMADGDTATAMQLPEFQPFVDSIFNFMKIHPTARLLIDLRFNSGGGANDGHRWAKRLAADSILNQKGKVFVAINSGTVNEATNVGIFFKTYTKAILIGEPTGDRPNHFATKKPLRLPKTGLILSYSSKITQLVAEDPPALAPEILVPMSFQSFLEGRDPVLDYLRKNKNKQ